MNAEPKTIVVALGGNALSPSGERATIAQQFRHTRESLSVVTDLARENWRIAIVHGNGTQVGDELTRNEIARASVEPLPLGVLVASTAGWIGYMIQQSLKNQLLRAGIDRDVITLVTQTAVDHDDPRLSRPTKPVGHGLDEESAARLKEIGVPIGKDGSGKLRRLAPSPTPVDVVEADAVKQLVREGKIVIAAGGGGPPVYLDSDTGWEGIDAVCDKDLAAASLALRLEADVFLILTEVDAVYRDWNTERATRIEHLSVEEAAELLESGELPEGSMRPKVAAAAQFARSGQGFAVIAHLTEGKAAVRRGVGTVIEKGTK